MTKSLCLSILYCLLPFFTNASDIDFFKNPELLSPKISPNGDRVLMKKGNDYDYNILVLDVETKKEEIIYSLPQSSKFRIGSFEWIDDDTIAFQRNHNRRATELHIYKNRSLGNWEEIETLENVVIFDPQKGIRDKLIVMKYKFDNVELFKIDLNGEKLVKQFRNKKRISRGPIKGGQWLVDKYGRTNVNFDSKEGVSKVYVRHNKSKRWQLVRENNEEFFFKPVRFNDVKNELLVISDHEDGYKKVYNYSITKREFIDVVFGIPGEEIVGVLQDPYTKEIIAYQYLLNGIVKNHYVEEVVGLSIDPNFDTISSTAYIIDFNMKRERLIYVTGGIDAPSRYYLFDTTTKENILLGKSRPWLDHYNLGQSEVIFSYSTDGQKIESYLTIPNVKTKKNFPLIVMPHGGPIGVQDNRHFSTEIQFFAEKGYAVLTPNYRGSSGFGKAFLEGGKQQWGRLIEDDIESAVKEVVKSKSIDRNKICIFGFSYGGYSALISGIRSPELYRCAISYAGVTDLTLLFSQSQHSEDLELQKIWRDIIGSPEESWDVLIENSPVYRLKDLKIPIFLAQGSLDRIVDDEHYFRMIYILRKLNIPFENMYFANEGHSFRTIENEMKFYVAVERFIRNELEKENSGN